MASKKQYVNGVILGSNGQIFHVETRNENLTDNKFFAAAVMCGHAGKGFFVPVIMSVAAKDKDAAVEVIKASPRVKEKSSRCILGLCEISLPEFDFIADINNCDPYFISHNKPPLEIRKVLLHTYADVIMKEQRGEPLTVQEKDMFNSIQTAKIRYAEDYNDYCILQKAFAPRLVADKIVYPSKINMDELLYEFYKDRIQVLGIIKKKSNILSACLQIFGFENEFGIKLDSTNNKISFANQNGDIESVEISEETKENILSRQNHRLTDAIKKFQKKTAPQTSPEIDTNVKIPSAIDKFNARLNKTKKVQEKEKAD